MIGLEIVTVYCENQEKYIAWKGQSCHAVEDGT